MKATVKIPKGWRRLKAVEYVQAGDRYLSIVGPEWVAVQTSGWRVSIGVVIRRKRRSGK